jgi:hypothetical protein
VRQGDTTVLRSASAETGATIITLPAALRAALPEDARLTVQLDRRDALPADDVAEVLRPRLRQVRVQVAMPERAGALRAAVLRAVAAVPETLLVDDATTAELVISADAASPADGPWRMHIAPAGTAASLGPYLMRAGHPLCRDADGTGVLWVGGMPRVALPADHSDVIAAGDLVLVSERRQGRNRTVMLHADPTVGTLVQHPLWPVLIANLIEARRDALPGVRDPNLSLGVASQAVLPLASTRAAMVSAPSPWRRMAMVGCQCRRWNGRAGGMWMPPPHQRHHDGRFRCWCGMRIPAAVIATGRSRWIAPPSQVISSGSNAVARRRHRWCRCC